MASETQDIHNRIRILAAGTSPAQTKLHAKEALSITGHTEYIVYSFCYFFQFLNTFQPFNPSTFKPLNL
jgi:hypothetical protein